MSLNPAGMGASANWNYSKADREDYSLELWGTIVALQEVQAREFNPNSNQPGRPAFWPDGNPKMNIRVGFATPDGSLKSITFAKAGKAQVSGEKPSLHMDLFRLTNGNMNELMGKTVHLWTWPVNPNTNQSWGRGNPRIFGVEEVADVHYELAGQLPEEYKVPELLCNDGATGGQPMAPSPQQMYVPQVPQYGAQMYPQQQQYVAPQGYVPQPQPMPQPMPQQRPQQYPQYQAPAQPMPAIQAMPPQPQTAPMPQGMDPAVAAAMQSVGAVNVQPVDGSVYDEDIPF